MSSEISIGRRAYEEVGRIFGKDVDARAKLGFEL